MRDRTPTRALENGALRYGVYAEDGSLLRYEYLALEDDPTDPGTELSKATLLQDSTEVSLFGSAADRTIDEAFAGIAGQLKLIKSDSAAITLTVQDTNGKPLPEVLVQGILSENGTAVYTNANGVAAGYIGEGAQVIKVSGYADLVDYSETVTVVKGTTINKTINLTTRNFLKITSSRSVRFSGNVNAVDVTVVGGGGSGGSAPYGKTVIGGGGGDCQVQPSVNFTVNALYNAVVGVGGIAIQSQYAGVDGGRSSFMGVIAAGGKGGGLDDYVQPKKAATIGLGNGRGGYVYQSKPYSENYPPDTYVEPVEGNVLGYSSFTESTYYGGGGQGGCHYLDGNKDDNHDINKTQTTYGGKASRSNATPGKDGFGGGGGARCGASSGTPGANGGSGCIAIRMHLKSAA